MSADTRTLMAKLKDTRPSGFIVKPFREQDVLVALEMALIRSHQNINNALLQQNEDWEEIINEALTNALKHAFPYSRGRIVLALHRLEECTCWLTVADNGVGLPTGFDPSQSRSQGMTLLHGLTAQLGGGLTITSPPVNIRVVFADQSSNSSPAVPDAQSH